MLHNVVHLILTLAQRYEMGKNGAEHSVTAALHYFTKKYPELSKKPVYKDLKACINLIVSSEEPGPLLFDTINLNVNIRYVLRNISSDIFIREISQIHQFFCQMCLYSQFTQVSCCQNFPPYGMQ